MAHQNQNADFWREKDQRKCGLGENESRITATRSRHDQGRFLSDDFWETIQQWRGQAAAERRFIGVKPRCHADRICIEVAGELRDMAVWLSGGEVDVAQFCRAVEAMEARKLARFGLCLQSAVSESGVAQFSLRFKESGELCASLDVDTRSGRTLLQTTCV